MSAGEDSLAQYVPLFRQFFEHHNAHIALIDLSGEIVAVNKAWRDFADANGVPPGYQFVGNNYFDICTFAVETHDPSAADILAGILGVASGVRPRYSAIYACHSTKEKRWFKLWVADQRPEVNALIIAHTFLGDTNPLSGG